MSRHDPRKALSVRLPEPLRLRLVARIPDRRPLPALLRGAVLSGLKSLSRTAPLVPVRPGAVRPILLQLSETERAQLARLARASGMTLEEAALALASAGAR